MAYLHIKTIGMLVVACYWQNEYTFVRVCNILYSFCFENIMCVYQTLHA